MKPLEPITSRLIDIRAASTYTGLAVDTLYKMVGQRRIPYVKMGRLVKFDLDKLNEWIRLNTVMPMPERTP